MRSRRDRAETVIRLLAAGAGTVLAHFVDYAALFPDRAARSRVLATTGHGYWHLAVLAAMAAGLAAAALVVARGASSGLWPDADRAAPGFRAADVIVVQAGVFAGIELLERVSAGLSPAVLLHEPAFRLGLVLQVVVGAAVALALALLHRAGSCVGAALGRARARRSRTRRPPWRLIDAGGSFRATLLGPSHQRAPPLAA